MPVQHEARARRYFDVRNLFLSKLQPVSQTSSWISPWREEEQSATRDAVCSQVVRGKTEKGSRVLRSLSLTSSSTSTSTGGEERDKLTSGAKHGFTLANGA
eukprot:3593940-Pleurochrysis_carterae.AAC.1